MEYKTTDKQFNESYAKKGMQPSVGVRPTIRNKRVVYREKVNEEPLEQPSFNTSVRNVKKETQNQQKLASVGLAGEKVDSTKEKKQKARKKQKQQKLKITKSKKEIKKRIKRKTAKIKRVVNVNNKIYSFFLGTLWWVQLILALISAIFFAASLAISSFTKTTAVSEGASFLEKISVWALNTLKETVTTLYSALSSVSEYLFGFNFTEAANPMNWFLLTYMVLFAFFIIELLIIYFMYKLVRIDPLLGSGAGLKTGTFLLCFILYCIPLLNIVPWFILWTVAVLAATAKE